MLELMESMTVAAVIAIDLGALTHVLPGSLVRRLAIAGVGGAWTGLAAWLGAAGRLTFSAQHPAPLIGILFAAPLLAVGLLAWTHGRMRAALLAIPLRVLIGINALRVLGLLFLLDAAAGKLSGPFPFCAGLGDIITGALAIPLALQAARSRELPRRALAWWNAFGALDLLTAMTLGLASANGTPLQLIHAGVGSQAMQFLPLCLVPTVLVPLYLLTHGIIAAQLRVTARRARGDAPWKSPSTASSQPLT